MLPEAGGRAIYTDLDPESIFGAATGPRSIPSAEVPTSTRPVDRRVKSGRKQKAIYTEEENISISEPGRDAAMREGVAKPSELFLLHRVRHGFTCRCE